MNSKLATIKAQVASYYRYIRQCPLVALEAPCRLEDSTVSGLADILVIDKKRFLTEIEVKTSLADLKRDGKKRKHRRFLAESASDDHRDYLGPYPTHLFYFAVPEEIVEQALEICKEQYPYAGVLRCEGISDYGVTVYQAAKVLSQRKVSYPRILAMVRSQSATLCRTLNELANMKRDWERESR